MAENSRTLKSEYGNISSASVGAIQRRLLVLDEQGASEFFGEPALKIDDFQRTDFGGNGVISILDATDLTSKSPRLYRESAYELLKQRAAQMAKMSAQQVKPKRVRSRQTATEVMFKSVARSVGSQLGRQIVRGIMGSLFGGRR
ncbi:helicase HerA-like domain-containing protein [Bathymodiolus japonicus methanotrophic gill symbiont]|uniref:helicase HerA-like domain-containing protein n=1 Tax=Bathymodiolus japonicus methanotrophic gill symbiont TaxID=113269 RepID=UPI001C8DD862|nr:helicase HerA-like domain-containing protein [Bathymodiolus japonicus methanotrophic gill symbiont]